jgi:hypothetical protein
MTSGSLWGDLSNFEEITTPKSILVEQAEILNRATNQVLRATVETARIDRDLVHSFDIVAPFLDDYRFSVCSLRHAITMYPCRLSSPGITSAQCDTEDELRTNLAAVLQSDRIRRAVASLLSQSRQ